MLVGYHQASNVSRVIQARRPPLYATIDRISLKLRTRRTL
jgi:hypothetical protein